MTGEFRAARETTFALMCELRQLGELRDLFFSPSEQKMVADVMRDVADKLDPMYRQSTRPHLFPQGGARDSHDAHLIVACHSGHPA
jgi:hypothetical protein